AVLTVAQFTRRAAIPCLVLLVGATLLWHAWTRTPNGRTSWHAWLLRVPLIGIVRRSAGTARYAQALAALLASGVPIAPALRSAADAAADAELTRRLLRSRDRIVHGTSISTALRAEDAATPTTLRLVQTGETTGCLADLLAHAASIEEERAERAVKTAVRLLE